MKYILAILLTVAMVSCEKETAPSQTIVNLTAIASVKTITNSQTTTGVWIELKVDKTIPEQLTANVQYDVFNGVNQFVSTNTSTATLQPNFTANNSYTGVTVAGNFTVRNLKILSVVNNNSNFVVKY